MLILSIITNTYHPILSTPHPLIKMTHRLHPNRMNRIQVRCNQLCLNQFAKALKRVMSLVSRLRGPVVPTYLQIAKMDPSQSSNQLTKKLTLPIIHVGCKDPLEVTHAELGLNLVSQPSEKWRHFYLTTTVSLACPKLNLST